MAVTPNSFVTPQAVGKPTYANCQFVNSDSTNKKTLYTAGTNGSVCLGIFGQTTDTSANNVFLYLSDGSTILPLGCVRVAAASGNDGATNSVSLLNQTALPALQLDGNGNPFLEIPGGYTLQASVLASVTSAKTLTLTPIVRDY